MDKKTKEQIVREVTADVIKSMHHPSVGSAYWKMAELLRSEIETDKDCKIYNDDFANGIGQLKEDTEKLQRKYFLAMYLSGAYVLYFILGHAIPITLPYINSTAVSITLNGIFEIVFITFLVASNQIFIHGSKADFYDMLLRTYVAARYGEKARDFYVLRWGLDDLFLYLSGEEYRGYKKTRQPNFALKLLTKLSSWVLIALPLVYLLIIVGAIMQIIIHPAFGWVSIFVVCATMIHFLNNAVSKLSMNLGNVYERTFEES